MFMPSRIVDYYKNAYPPGTKVMLDQMNDESRPVPPGTMGTVNHVDDAGTIHTDFDNGKRLGICPEVDEFHKIEPTENETPLISM